MFGIFKRIKKLEEGLQEVCTHKFSSSSFRQRWHGCSIFYKTCDICGKEFGFSHSEYWDAQKNTAKLKELKEEVFNLEKEGVFDGCNRI